MRSVEPCGKAVAAPIRTKGLPHERRVIQPRYTVAAGRRHHGRVHSGYRGARGLVPTHALTACRPTGTPDDCHDAVTPTKRVSRVLYPGRNRGDDHLSRAPITRRLKQPTRKSGGAIPEQPQAALLPIRSCSRWGLPRPDGHPPAGELLPHHFTLTRPEGRRRYVSVALSLKSPSLGVTQHLGSLELGLSSRGQAARGRPAWLRHSKA